MNGKNKKFFETFNILLLIEGFQLREKFKNILHNLYDIRNDLHISKESNIFVNRELESFINIHVANFPNVIINVENCYEKINNKIKKLMVRF